MPTRFGCRTQLALTVVLVTVLGATPGCFFDKRGFEVSDDAGQNNTTLPDSEVADGTAWLDATPDVYVPPCQGNTFECLGDSTARECVADDWVDVGYCPLGCDAATRACRVPSNVDAELYGETSAGLDVGASDTPVTIFTDTGEIGGGAGLIRAPGTGLDVPSGIYYKRLDQGGNPGLGVFVVKGLTIGAGTSVTVVGQRALVLLVDGAASINGIVDVSARSNVGGPGGYNGGDPAMQGAGSCGGAPGHAEDISHGCSSGGGGGGHAGAGGDGGDATCGSDFPGGTGGPATCGVPELIPLVGGSGGAGGPPIPNVTAAPGAGGGGGGAIQISATAGITVSASGGINAGGGGGTGCTSAGGSGGGAGGGILLEGTTVSVLGGSTLAANGGGGGGGDCT